MKVLRKEPPRPKAWCFICSTDHPWAEPCKPWKGPDLDRKGAAS